MNSFCRTAKEKVPKFFPETSFFPLPSLMLRREAMSILFRAQMKGCLHLSVSRERCKPIARLISRCHISLAYNGPIIYPANGFILQIFLPSSSMSFGLEERETNGMITLWRHSTQNYLIQTDIDEFELREHLFKRRWIVAKTICKPVPAVASFIFLGMKSEKTMDFFRFG